MYKSTIRITGRDSTHRFSKI